MIGKFDLIWPHLGQIRSKPPSKSVDDVIRSNDPSLTISAHNMTQKTRAAGHLWELFNSDFL